MTPSLDMEGWWKCCVCWDNVNPEWTCLCNHEQCDECTLLTVPPSPPGSSLGGDWDELSESRVTYYPETSSHEEASEISARKDTSNQAEQNFDELKAGTGGSEAVADAHKSHDVEPTILSKVSSLVSLADSLLSIASLSSKSSIQGPDGAGERLALVILQDRLLLGIFQEALEKIALDRLARNLRRLLVLLGNDLKEEATSPQERRVASFVKSKATYAASLIRDELDPNAKSNSKKTTFDASDDSGPDRDAEELDLERFQAFITDSRAFDTFRTNLRSFIRPSLTEAPKNGEKLTRDLLSVLPFCDLDATLLVQEILPSECRPDKLLNYLNRKVNFCFRNPRLEKGLKRVTWTCSCGVNLYDDYEELEPRAAKRLQKVLRSTYRQQNLRQRLGYHQILANASASVKSLMVVFGTLVSDLSRRVMRRAPSLPSYEMELAQQPPQATEQRPVPTETLYLLLCVGNSTGTSAPKAYQPPVHEIDSDRAFFQMLGRYHASIRRRWWSWISIWELRHIHFVHFLMFEKSLVDIKARHAVPPEDYNMFYRYERCGVKPPIGSNMMMHYFHHPNDASTIAPPCLEKVPKKINGELAICPVKRESPGWGLQFEEGLSWTKILTWLCLLFIVASVLEGIFYCKFQHSVQDAMAVGTFILTCFGIAVATLQAWLMIS